MKKNLTEIVIVLDESGSMSLGKDDTIGGFNEFLKTQKKMKGTANFTLVKFSDYYKLINDGTAIEDVSPLNEQNYTPSNSTALLDAVGRTINSVEKRLSNTPKKKRPEKVIFVILTDGQENDSKEFTRSQIFDLVKKQRNERDWEFLFLGADIDAWGAEIGISYNISFSKVDTENKFRGISHYTANYRAGNETSLASFDMSDEDLDKELEDLAK